MNLYEYHPDPENALGYVTRYDDVPELVWEKYKKQPEELKKREATLAKEARYAYWYARYVLMAPFPAGEPAIAKSSACAYFYAAEILNGPFPAGEAALAEDGHYAACYARYVLKLSQNEARAWGKQ